MNINLELWVRLKSQTLSSCRAGGCATGKPKQ